MLRWFSPTRPRRRRVALLFEIARTSRKKEVEVISVTPGEVLVEMDEVLMQRLIANLISNAIDASRPQSQIHVHLERLTRANAILFDGTLFTDDEMIKSGTGEKTGRRMGHMPIDGADGSLAAFAGLNTGLGRRRIYIHINNTNPILIDGSPERARVEAAGWEVAADGQEILL